MDTKKTISTRALSLLLAVLLMLTLVPTLAFATDAAENKWDSSIATAFAAGDGTAGNPYQISSGAQLAFLASEVNNGKTYADTYFKLIADIDLNNLQWTPIGNTIINMLFDTPTGNYYFAGTFDGANHKVSNLSIGSDGSPYVSDVCGLFGASMGTIKNLNLNNVSINYTAGVSGGFVVGICGSLSGYTAGAVSNCNVTGLSMTTNHPASDWGGLIAAGGLAGILDSSSSIANCSAAGMITDQSGNYFAGGFIGELGEKSSVTYCGANVNVSSVKTANGGAVGGFIGMGNGETDSATWINHCYATGNVSGGGYAGGFCGNLTGLNIKNSYATGNVSDSYYGGSFAGSDGAGSLYYGHIENCYTTGTVSDIQVNAYAFFPQTDMPRSTITNCYFNNDLTPAVHETAAGISLSDMKKSSFGEQLNNGDPANGWIIQEGRTPYSGAEPANYDAVNAAIAEIPADLSLYTDASMQVLNQAKDSVVTGKNIAEQATVDNYASAIENALNSLVYKDADYSKINAAIEKAKALNAADYKDFSAVTTAINAVVTGKNITEQTTVDGYATAIETAVNALAKKDSSAPGASSDPTVPATPVQKTKTNTPQTGDNGNTALWLALLFVSGGAATVFCIAKKRKKSTASKQ